MKMPPEENICKVLREKCDYKHIDYNMACLTEYIFYEKSLSKVCTAIIDLFKLTQIDEEAVPEVDPNLVKIAQLEAKIRVYETVISSAGINLKIMKEKGECGFAKKK